jgi:hypothetical protein
MAMSAKDEDDPSITLSADHSAHVLHFLSCVEPLEPVVWWEDPDDSPSHLVEFVFVLRTLEKSLREKESHA